MHKVTVTLGFAPCDGSDKLPLAIVREEIGKSLLNYVATVRCGEKLAAYKVEEVKIKRVLSPS